MQEVCYKENLMSTVVYSTSPLQAFLWTFVGLGVLVLIGLGAGIPAGEPSASEERGL